jgi:gluconolactonase
MGRPDGSFGDLPADSLSLDAKDRMRNFRSSFQLIVSVVLAAPLALFAQGRTDTVWHGTPIRVSSQFKFTEGPASDAQGNVFFTDQPNNRIWKYATDGTLSIFMDPAGRSNGMFVDRKGNLISCADEHDQLWSISPKGKVTVLVKNFEGIRMNGPNDVWVSPKGGIYFSDPYYQRDYWKRKSPSLKSMDVYYLAPGATTPVRVIDDLKRPNGLIGTPDGKTLYVSDIDANKIYVYKIRADGSLDKGRLFFQGLRTDGMTIDNRGNVYLCGKGVSIISPRGVQTGHIPIPEPWSANACFGGVRDDTLFIAASTALYKVPTNVQGVR